MGRGKMLKTFKAALFAVSLLASSVSFYALSSSAHAAPACADESLQGRTIIVPAKVENYGTMQYGQTVDMEDRELVLTFDDGPDEKATLRILDTLDQYCVKATFFFTGLRAARYPHLVREAALRGHTIASHSYSHPNNLRRLSWNRAVGQIQRGISEIQGALDADDATSGMKVAPFFRFPGLNHSSPLRGWLASQNISTFSCDVGTDDWRRISSSAVVYRALRNIRSKRGGIVIFHDTKVRTANALPSVLEQLRAEGYRVAHMVPEAAVTADHLAHTQDDLTTATIEPQAPTSNTTALEPMPALSIE
jgi:peptidoglycan-N-acetylglucosamine deacetylase